MSGEAGRIVRIAGGLAEAKPLSGAGLYELARVGDAGLLAEVIRVEGDRGTLQVYEETTGLSLGEEVALTGGPLTARLGPGLLGAVLDGVGRPLPLIAERVGAFVERGVRADTLEGTGRWRFRPAVGSGDPVRGGTVLGTVEERPGFEHRIMVPPARSGTVEWIEAGEYRVDDPIGALDDDQPLTLAQEWAVRRPRPAGGRLAMDRPFITGQRVLDFLFPVAEGSSAAVPGGFGTGKTVIEHSLAKFAEADVVVFVGCGERGNEMTEVLTEFPELVDPRSGRPVMERAVLIVNTSNMPVAARESSIYLGVTVAEYYRDMGYRVALMVDSTSRWAEALREIGSRLGEMPGEEGFPTYLASRLGQFYERAGRVTAAGDPERTGAVTIISAVSPPGGDFSEPVTQASLRVAGALWALDPDLAHQRHFPAVDWETSYSYHADAAAAWLAGEVGEDWAELRGRVLELLSRESELREIAGLVGPEALEDRDRLTMEAAAVLREVVLRQNAYDPNDAFSPPRKTYQLVRLAMTLYEAGLEALDAGVPADKLDLDPAARALAAVRDAPEGERADLIEEVRSAIDRLRAPGGQP